MKQIILGTGSLVTLMPSDKQILKKAEIQKETNRYQDPNNHEVKVRGKYL